ncbi:hypothetical protein [Streptomyces sp. GS7]|uniref:hypothetical protein n=1 Tax=Streptomyces sp. GS7 TaxID=2692234 RepID=UPI001318E377|nr:hypothetical protein [Streptomyces sp. GS7]QHC22605.1 hypothetical protein GR130_15380 [Streptomyces sp. GS7]
MAPAGGSEDLEPLVRRALNPAGWEESQGVSVEDLNRETIEAAKQLPSRRKAEDPEG